MKEGKKKAKQNNNQGQVVHKPVNVNPGLQVN